VGRERGYPLGACGSPCDADYEDGSVPLQLPLFCADHRIEARREGCHLREIEGVRQRVMCDPELLRIISARQIVVRAAPRPQALRLRRTATRLRGLTAQCDQQTGIRALIWVLR
jgi:hypothetical protein